MQLEGKTAVVTGAGRGLGREISVAMAEQGADLVLGARSTDSLEETKGLVEDQGREALVVETDVSDPDSVESLASAALDRFDAVHVLVNNSGVEGPTAPLWEISPDDWRQVLEVNLTGAFLCSRAFLPSMIDRGEGSIVMISSILARRQMWGRTPYTASKLGMVAMARTLATECGEHGIRVNMVSPGAVEGERLDNVFQEQADHEGVSLEDVKDRFRDMSSLRTLMSARDIANAVIYLSSDAAKHITGEDMNLTGGVVMY